MSPGAHDPLDFGRHRRDNVTQRQMKIDHPKGDKRKLKKYYTRQNDLINQFLGSGDEERLAVEEDIRMAPKIKFAVNASFTVNFCLFVIQLYAAVSTGSLSVSHGIPGLRTAFYHDPFSKKKIAFYFLLFSPGVFASAQILTKSELTCLIKH